MMVNMYIQKDKKMVSSEKLQISILKIIMNDVVVCTYHSPLTLLDTLFFSFIGLLLRFFPFVLI